MKLRPTIFLSGVSSEFGSFRDAVETEIQKKGCFPLNQTSFPPDYRTVEEMLRQHLSEADAVIHIAGFRFGAEPSQRPDDKPRRSYTQMEFDIAQEMQKPIYVFLSAAPDSNEQLENGEVVALQLAHRQVIQGGNHFYDVFKDEDELRRKVAQIPIVATTEFRVDVSRIDKYAPAELIGREDELKLLNDAWSKVRLAESKRPHIITFVALGGEGKTSLVAKWLAQLAHDGWPGCDVAFAWSFYSQGTREQVAASSDLFLKEAITFFGNEEDKEFAASSAGAYEKGQRLARIVGQRRSLLILDGLEPLQYAPTSPTAGELKDSGIAVLLKGLAADSDGLCIITTRYSLPDLKAFWQTTAPEVKLFRLSPKAGVHLLRALGVNGTSREFESLVEDVKGHALTLNLLGTYLRDAHGGDIRRRDLVKLEEANAEEHGGHAFRVMEAYERAFKKEGNKGQQALAVLRLLGLFDRPVTANCLTALLEKPAIVGLTEPLVELSGPQHHLVLTRLEDAKLVTTNREGTGTLVSLDAHPLLREYFARELRTHHSEAWRAAHRRLYEQLCATTSDKRQPTLEDLQPLYQAVAHACNAGLQREAFDEVYLTRILRGQEFYNTKRLGAFASDLGAVACFFDVPWSNPSLALTDVNQSSLLAIAAYNLQALGRITEALIPVRVSLESSVRRESWKHAAIRVSNLSQLELMLGNLPEAVKNAEQSVIYADQSGDAFQGVSKRAFHADALHQAGQRNEAKARFHEAEQMQAADQPHFPLLYSAQGFLYVDLLLATLDRAAWKSVLQFGDLSPLSAGDSSEVKSNAIPTRQKKSAEGSETSLYSKELRAVSRRAVQTLKWAKDNNLSILSVALGHLALGRAMLYEAVLSEVGLLLNPKDSMLKVILDDAVNDLRRASAQEFIVRGLLTRAWLRFLTGIGTGPASAQADLDEAWEIAERGPMRLHMADIHHYRARLFFKEEKYPWGGAREDLEAAEKLINECGYHRRDEELADAKRVILS